MSNAPRSAAHDGFCLKDVKSADFVIFKLDLGRFQPPRTDKWIGCFGARHVFSAALLCLLRETTTRVDCSPD